MNTRRQFTLKYLFLVVTALAIVFAVARTLTVPVVAAVADGMLVGVVTLGLLGQAYVHLTGRQHASRASDIRMTGFIVTGAVLGGGGGFLANEFHGIWTFLAVLTLLTIAAVFVGTIFRQTRRCGRGGVKAEPGAQE